MELTFNLTLVVISSKRRLMLSVTIRIGRFVGIVKSIQSFRLLRVRRCAEGDRVLSRLCVIQLRRCYTVEAWNHVMETS